MMEPSSFHSTSTSCSGDGSLMSFDNDDDETASLYDFLSDTGIESEYDSGLDTSYSDFSCSTAGTSLTSATDEKEDSNKEGCKDKGGLIYEKEATTDTNTTMKGTTYDEGMSFEPPTTFGIDSITDQMSGLSPPSLPRPSMSTLKTTPGADMDDDETGSIEVSADDTKGRTSIGSMFESLMSKPISSIGSIGTVASTFDFRDAFPPLPLTELSRQVTPNAVAAAQKFKNFCTHPPPIPESIPFKDGYENKTPSRTISQDTDDIAMDIEVETPAQGRKLPAATKPTAEDRTDNWPSPSPVVPPPPPPAITPPTPSRKQRSVNIPASAEACDSGVPPKAGLSPHKTSGKSKRRKRQNKKKRQRRTEPEVKKYVTISSKDVLMGRGGRSNHHDGNEAYRKRILDLQRTYKGLSRDEKTQMSKDVVKWVCRRGGKFLQKEGTGPTAKWYVVTSETARQKVSQALREDLTFEGRMAKKSRTTGFQEKQQEKVSSSVV